jgi:hypothetical protein
MQKMKRAGEIVLWGVIVLATAIVLLLVLHLSTAHANEPKFGPYTCEDVRRTIADVGKVRALAIAVESGLSLRQIWQIRKTCKV